VKLRSIEGLAHPDFDAVSRIRLLGERIGEIVLGHADAVKLAVCCLLARGHLLIEDRPGVGKTTLAQALSRAAGLPFSRIQFTSDLLPADILGVSIYDSDTASFRFHRGPVFANVVLADEINRATPKAQSALLEAMEERRITVDGATYRLPQPFLVIATQNPLQQVGTYPLPESQLDRFLMRIELGYPGREAERELLTGADRRHLLEALTPALAAAELLEIQATVDAMPVNPVLLDYVQALLEATRAAPWLRSGLSPRAGLSLVHAARAWAMASGRAIVIPDDVQAVAPAVVGHRLHATDRNGPAGTDSALRLLDSVPVP
jgi:MoxR-like ATPase